MNSYPDEQTVLADLGDKFVECFVKSVDSARVDLVDFQGFRPQWFVNFSKRFVANFVHERMWDVMLRTAGELPGVEVVDKEPVRQLCVGSKYVIRFKRHNQKAVIRSYPTSGALAFWTNRATPSLPGMELSSLAMGYVWDSETGEIADAILSFRDSRDTPVWQVRLHSEQEGDTVVITTSPLDPLMPEIDLSGFTSDDEESTEGS